MRPSDKMDFGSCGKAADVLQEMGCEGIRGEARRGLGVCVCVQPVAELTEDARRRMWWLIAPCGGREYI